MAMPPAFKPSVATVAADVEGLKVTMEGVKQDILYIHTRYDGELVIIRHDMKENRDAFMGQFGKVTDMLVEQDKVMQSILQANAARAGSVAAAKWFVGFLVGILAPGVAVLGYLHK